MSHFLLAFLGSLFAGLIIALIDAKFRKPETAFEHATARPFHHPILLRVSAFVVAATWIALLCLVVSMVLGIFLIIPSFGAAFLWAAGATVGLALIYTPLAFTLYCQSCRRHLLVQWTTEPPFAEKQHGLNGWSAIILRVLMRKSFRCMYCGQRYVG